MAVVFKGCVTLPMPCAIGIRLPNGLGHGRPNDGDIFIADVNSNAGRIGARVIATWREAIGLAVVALDNISARLGDSDHVLRIGNYTVSVKLLFPFADLLNGQVAS